VKTPKYLLAISVVIGIASAQDANPQQNESKSPPPAAKPAQTTSNFKGTLMDASCAASGGSMASSAANVPDAAPQSAGSKSKERKNEAARSAADNAGQACSVSSSTSQFALKLEDGRTVQFDSVGNLRAQEAFKDKKKWNEAAASGKPIRAKVSGFMTGDKLMVMSIN
jgi:hypothetical protein